MNPTSIGAVLGTVAFTALIGIGVHQAIEINHLSKNRPPTLLNLMDSVVTLETGTSICSGYISAKDHKIHTAAHCFDFIDGAHDAVVHFRDDHTELWVTDKVDTGFSDKTDRATLVPKEVSDSKPSGGLMDCSFVPYYGEPIVLMGAPLGVAKSISFGHVAKPDAGDGMIEIDVRMLPGNSGGPLLDMTLGCVLGTSEEVELAAPGSGVPFGLNYATPIERVPQ